jgi:hypothetical protein
MGFFSRCILKYYSATTSKLMRATAILQSLSNIQQFRFGFPLEKLNLLELNESPQKIL